MSENGCLMNDFLNSVSVDNKAVTEKLHYISGKKIESYFNSDKNGNEKITRKFINSEIAEGITIEGSVRGVNSIQAYNNASAGGTIKTEYIQFKKNTIIENIYLRIVNNSFFLNTGENLMLEIGLSDRDEGDNYNIPESDFLFINTEDHEGSITLYSCDDDVIPDPVGENPRELVTMLSVDTLIPILSDFRLNTKRDRILSNVGGTTFGTTSMNEIALKQNTNELNELVSSPGLYNPGEDKYIVCKIYVTNGQGEMTSNFRGWTSYSSIRTIYTNAERIPKARGYIIEQNRSNRNAQEAHAKSIYYHSPVRTMGSQSSPAFYNQNNEQAFYPDDVDDDTDLSQYGGRIELTVQFRKLAGDE